MPTYRLFFLDRNAKVRNSLACECVDDAEALAWALAQPRNQPTELWQGVRVVERIEASHHGSALEDPAAL